MGLNCKLPTCEEVVLFLRFCLAGKLGPQKERVLIKAQKLEGNWAFTTWPTSSFVFIFHTWYQFVSEKWGFCHPSHSLSQLEASPSSLKLLASVFFFSDGCSVARKKYRLGFQKSLAYLPAVFEDGRELSGVQTAKMNLRVAKSTGALTYLKTQDWLREGSREREIRENGRLFVFSFSPPPGVLLKKKRLASCEITAPEKPGWSVESVWLLFVKSIQQSSSIQCLVMTNLLNAFH